MTVKSKPAADTAKTSQAAPHLGRKECNSNEKLCSNFSCKMAQAEDNQYEEQFRCSICLDLLKVPVTIPCGHTYCMDCIKGTWDQDGHIGVYSCPQCRHTFTSRPVLGRNTMLAEVMEKLKKAEVQAAPPGPPAHSSSGPGDVECDVCTGRKKKAVKSCLVCLASYCETHLQLHEKLNRRQKHELIVAKKLQENVCSRHDKPLEIFCHTDHRFICSLCTVDEHRDHDTVTAAVKRTRKQKQVEVVHKEIKQLIQQREEEMEELRQAVDSLTRRRSEVRDLIRAQEKAAIRRAEELLERLTQDIGKLRRTGSQLEELLNTKDHICFLKGYQYVYFPPGPEDLPSITLSPHFSFGDAMKFVSELKKQLEDISEEKLGQTAVKDACELTLDPNTVYKDIFLFEGNRKVEWALTAQSHPEHPERFDYWGQVLVCLGAGTGRLSGGGKDGVHVAVAYKTMNRKGRGKDSRLGYNDKSWSLCCSPSSYSFYHNNRRTTVFGPHSSTIGVYLDHRAGTLCFYSISEDTMTLLHRVQTTFTEPLYPAFRNTMLAEVLEKVKKAEVQAAPPDRCYAGPGDAECDVCIGRKKKAVKSCLVCLASYCETHLQPHYESPAFKKNKLIDTTGQLQDKICSLREKWLEVYCRTDQQCICYQCLMDEHKGHDSLSCCRKYFIQTRNVADQPKYEKSVLMEREFQQRIQERKKVLPELRQAVDSLTVSTEQRRRAIRGLTLEDTESIFSEMIRSIERRRSKVRDLIRGQEKSEGSRAEGLLERLEQEIDELKRRDDELEQLSHTEDHIYFLQSRWGATIRIGVFKLWSKKTGQERVEEKRREEKRREEKRKEKRREEKRREEKSACQLTLDPNTVSVYFSLFEGGALMRHPQSHPGHAERFDGWEQVLCEEGLTGRCYWEVKWRGKWVHIGVSYKGTSRKGHGKDSCLGHNNKSWSLFCSPYDYHFTHNDKKTPVSGPCSSTIGVYLDHSTGTLSFYSISEDTMTLHHRVQTTFTEPLYPAFGYCMDCIKGCWDQEDQVGVYRCPQCRHTFTPRPVLGRNTMLAEVVEKVKKSGLQAAPPAPFSSGPGDVECDVCIGRKKKAVKSCLVCLASYCRTHLQPHYESAPLRKHKLTDSTGHLQDKICSLHDKVLELYCRTDRQCVCYLCTVDEHRGHNTVSAAAEKNKKQVYQCVCVPPGPGKLPAFTINPHCSFGDVRKPVLELKKQVELSCKKKIEKILQKGQNFIQTRVICAVLHRGKKATRGFDLTENAQNSFHSSKLHKCPSIISCSLSSDSCQLSLDPNTAQRELSLSEGNREVRRRGKPQPYPDHPHRFDWPQVLCREGLTGRCYWEVEWSGTSGVYIAVAYKGIGRRGRTCNCGLGGNDKSWSLVCSVSSYSFWHNNERTEVYGPSSSTIGVYLDHSAGALSFYSVSKDTMTLLHRVQTSFTEPLYPGFYVFKGTDAKLCSVP
ncbi:tripartite motif-containing protein 16-like [Scleropages formosus]|uniref:Tripartite motif-containing protein 16-like n=1 Tax=Scleropages formosus TaxID=113540 RepID=A0A0P7UKY1_SCLFO|nr:tripartite motif-containing protein 16-like [Scleropages formosus]